MQDIINIGVKRPVQQKDGDEILHTRIHHKISIFSSSTEQFRKNIRIIL